MLVFFIFSIYIKSKKNIRKQRGKLLLQQQKPVVADR